MALYCYMLSFYDYSDSEFLLVFHEKKFTKEEFQEICNKVTKIIEENENKKWKWNYPSEYLKVLIHEFGFQDVDILECDTINGKVTTYGEME